VILKICHTLINT